MTLAYAQLAAAMALVGLNVVVLKLLAASLPIAVILALRCAMAALIVLPFVWRTLSRPGPAALRNLAAQAAVGSIAYNVLLLLGVQRTGALEAGLVLATLPAIVALGAFLALREPLPARRAAAALMAAAGMAALALGRGGDAPLALLGDALVFAAVVAEAAYMLLAKANATRISPLVGTFWMQVISGLLMAPLAAHAWPADPITLPTLALLLFHAVTASVLAVILWYAGLRRVPGGIAGIFAGLLPLTAGLASILLLHEQPTWPHAAGAALMAASIALATWPAARTHPVPRPANTL